MSYDTLLRTMGEASVPVLICVGLITLGVLCDYYTNIVASEGRRVWRRIRADVRRFSRN